MKHGSKRALVTKQRILDAGLRLARKGLDTITLRAVGDEADISHTNIAYYFGNAEGLRDAVAEHALKMRDAEAIAHLIVDKHPSITTLTLAERRLYLGL